MPFKVFADGFSGYDNHVTSELAGNGELLKSYLSQLKRHKFLTYDHVDDIATDEKKYL